jgi:hypothetical protein
VHFTTFGFGDSSYVKYTDTFIIVNRGPINSAADLIGLLENFISVWNNWERKRSIPEARLTSNIQKGA